MNKNLLNWKKLWEDFDKWYAKNGINEDASWEKQQNKIKKLVEKQLRDPFYKK